MTLSSVKVGDVVEVDKKGRRFFARVTLVGESSLTLRPLDNRISYRSCTAREVIGIWHANKHTRARYAESVTS